MIVPFQEAPVPQARDYGDIHELVGRMRSDGLPAFLITALSTPEAKEAFAEAGVPWLGGLVSRTNLVPYNAPRDYSPIPVHDLPLHIDTRPKDYIADYLDIHQTFQGNVTAHFFEVADEWRQVLAAEDGHPRLPDTAGLQTLFEAGQTDDNIVQPIDHVAEIPKGSAVVFRHSGYYPLVHYFQTTRFPRLSFIYLAQVSEPVPAQALISGR